MIDNQLMSDL